MSERHQEGLEESLRLSDSRARVSTRRGCKRLVISCPSIVKSSLHLPVDVGKIVEPRISMLVTILCIVDSLIDYLFNLPLDCCNIGWVLLIVVRIKN